MQVRQIFCDAAFGNWGAICHPRNEVAYRVIFEAHVHLEDARRMFLSLPRAKSWWWIQMMAAYAGYGKVAEASEIYNWMPQPAAHCHHRIPSLPSLLAKCIKVANLMPETTRHTITWTSIMDACTMVLSAVLTAFSAPVELRDMGLSVEHYCAAHTADEEQTLRDNAIPFVAMPGHRHSLTFR
ncbi:hypothetical protein SELMODRAFT_432405 [Selaginella moellendorffii]|uniref:Pentatricopeptide repeat-containing protein n=1 Tax=Selaginella moellendorffii TaxID=88036 RepID=D8TFW8_SELML|nr:hypothetical protein SELMODRAFT_432405 [Selaginella moellendorffii]